MTLIGVHPYVYFHANSLRSFCNRNPSATTQYSITKIWRRTCSSLFILHWHISTYVYSLQAIGHPRCVGWGEIGLDYHYDHSPRDVQRSIFARQLQLAVGLGKSLTIHTREADEDTERILKENVPQDHKVRIDFQVLIQVTDLPLIRYISIVLRTPLILLKDF